MASWAATLLVASAAGAQEQTTAEEPDAVDWAPAASDWAPGSGAANALPTPDEFSSDVLLPRAMSSDALEALAARVCPAVFPVEVTVDLGPELWPRTMTGDGVAVLIRLSPDAEPALVTAHAYIANAATVRVWIDGDWVDATPVYASGMFDLTTLQVPSLPDVEPLPLATRWAGGGSLYVPSETRREWLVRQQAETLVPTSGGFRATTSGRERTANERIASLSAGGPVQASSLRSGGPPISIVGLGRPIRDNAYYVRVPASPRNGYPVVGADGAVHAILSYAVDDRRGGTAAIPLQHVEAWVREWGQIDGDSPLGWQPAERTQPFELDTQPFR